MNYEEVSKRIIAAEGLLSADTTTRAKFKHLCTLLKNIHPKLDKAIEKSSGALDDFEKLEKGDIISLHVKHLPSNTEEERKRKKLLLLFINAWKDLKSEVDRVQKELDLDHSQKSHAKNPAVTFANILWKAKGPLGLVTAIAVVIVIAKSSERTIAIKNNGCDAVSPISYIPPLPGFEFPNKPILDGETGIVKIIPVTAMIDATNKNRIHIKAYGINLNFDANTDGITILFDGNSIMGKTSTINLGDRPTHDLLISCK